jgi:O-antigen/teichoic acid export membrane protein
VKIFPRLDARLIRGVGFTYLHYGTYFLSIFLLTPALVAHLGQTSYGIWAMFASVFGYFGLFQSGFNTSMLKFTAEYRATDQHDKVRRLLSTGLAACLASSVIILGGSAALLPQIASLLDVEPASAPEVRMAFMVMALNVVCVLFANLLGHFIAGCQRVDIFKLGAAAGVAANLLLTLWALDRGWNLVGAAWMTLAGSVILLVFYAIYFRRTYWDLRPGPPAWHQDIVTDTGAYAARNFVLGAVSQIVYFTDSLVIGFFLGPASVTAYAIAYRLCFLSTYWVSAVSSSAFPKVTALYEHQDYPALQKYLLRLTQVSIGVMAPIAIFLMFGGKVFIDWWVGPGNFVGWRTFAIFVAMNFIHAYGSTPVMMLQAIGKNKRLVHADVANGILNLVISLVLVQSLGVLGVALGTLVASLLTGAWAAPWLICKYVRLPFRQYVVHGIALPIAATAALGIVLWLIGSS